MAWKKANIRAHLRSGRAKRSATARQCPDCNRKGALERLPTEVETFDGLFRAKPAKLQCRWRDCQWTGTYEDKREAFATR